jgi:GT2 family glycosyltransferase
MQDTLSGIQTDSRSSLISDSSEVAMIIPSLSGQVDRLLRSLSTQSITPSEIKIVTGVNPNGRARNQGVSATLSEILFFIDDDALPADEHLIKGLIEPLLMDPQIGVTGAARILPNDASWFQRRVAAEIPRTINPIPHSPLETNPPTLGYGHTQITTTCCAMRREVFDQAGGFSEQLTSGVDTDFFYRVRKLGYRFVMVPNVCVEHPAPKNLQTLFRKFHWYGLGYGQETQKRPEQKMGPRLPTLAHRIAFILAATLWVIPNIFILYSFGYPHFELGFRPFKALSTYSVAWGYVKSWQRGLK